MKQQEKQLLQQIFMNNIVLLTVYKSSLTTECYNTSCSLKRQMLRYFGKKVRNVTNTKAELVNTIHIT